MNLLVCPLCGKSSSLRRFDPTDFDDISTQHVRGLGWSSGFAVTDRCSLLGDKEIVKLIGDRTLGILRLLLDHGVYAPNDVSAIFEGGSIDTERVVGLVAEIEDALGDA